MSEFRVEQQNTRQQRQIKIRKNLIRVAIGAVLPILILGIWQILSTNGSFSASQLPPPVEVVQAAIGLIERGTLWEHLAICNWFSARNHFGFCSWFI
jgi:sulfonate transport system permease protein